MVVFLRSTEANPDPRMQKYLNAMIDNNINYHVFAWDRLGGNVRENFSYFKRKTTYGSGYRNLLNIFLFNVYLLFNLCKNRKKVTCIHACDFDTILPAIFMKIFFSKVVVYDIFDWYVDSRYIASSFVKKTIFSIENFCLKRVDFTILCEEERKKQLSYLPPNVWVLPNIPVFKQLDYKENVLKKRLKFSYVGVFARYRGLEQMVDYVKKNPLLCELHIAGVGELEELIIDCTKGCENIVYYGKVNYELGLKIMQESNIILAMYEKKIPNHIYAAPNKYYEGLFLGRPILTTLGTYVGDKSLINKTGFVIGESVNDIVNLFHDKSLLENILQFSDNAHQLWINRYERYVDCFMKNEYLRIVK